jgi:hypothetical protein
MASVGIAPALYLGVSTPTLPPTHSFPQSLQGKMLGYYMNPFSMILLCKNPTIYCQEVQYMDLPSSVGKNLTL